MSESFYCCAKQFTKCNNNFEAPYFPDIAAIHPVCHSWLCCQCLIYQWRYMYCDYHSWLYSLAHCPNGHDGVIGLG
jgi:hypothetical protein